MVLTQSCLSRLGRGGKEATARLLRLENLARPHGTFFVLTGLEFSRGRKGVGLRARTHAQCTLGPGPSALPRHDGKIFRISWRKWATAAGGYRAEASESIIGEPWNVVL